MQQDSKQQGVIFDYSPSILPLRKGEAPTSEPLTREKLDELLDSPRAEQIQQRIEAIVPQVTPDMTEEQFKAEMRVVKDEVNKLKKQHAVIIPGAHSLTGIRKVTGPDSYVSSRLVTLDVDNNMYPDLLWNSRIRGKAELLRVVMAFKTPSCHGLKVIFDRPENLTPEMAMRWMAHELGIEEYDTSVKDPLRAHYLVPRRYVYHYDPDKMFDAEWVNQPYTVDVPTELLLEALDEEDTDSTYQSAPVVEPEAAEAEVPAASPEVYTYQGIPYSEIESMYWTVNHGGKRPCVGDRNTLTFEIALAFRHICGYDPKLMMVVIPSYAGFPEAEKLQTIKNAIAYKQGPMPRKLTEVLARIKALHTDKPDVLQAIEEVEEQDASYYLHRFIECFDRNHAIIPMGIRDTFVGLPETLQMPALIVVGPFIGGLATHVCLKIHDDVYFINLQAMLCGHAASGKSKMDQIFNLWCWKLIEQDAVNLLIMADWRALPKKKRETTPRPQVKLRIQPLRCSLADVLDHLNKASGAHLISYGSEADQKSQSKRSGAFADTSVLDRLAFDNAAYSSSYQGESAVNSNIPCVKWNSAQCTTPDGLYRAVTNVTDGSLTRLSIARTPDTTFAPLRRVAPRTEKACQNIRIIAALLMEMSGQLELPLLEERSAQWLERIRLATLKDDDRVRANLRQRIAVQAQRYVCCLMLCGYAEWLLTKLDRRRKGAALPKWAHGAEKAEQYLKAHPDALVKQLPKLMQTPAYLDTFDVFADYLLDNVHYFFSERIQKAYEQSDYKTGDRPRRGKNDSVFDQLGQKFTLEEARRAKGSNSTDNAARQMLKNWCLQGLCRNIGYGQYEKC